jgi:hypothetical protein
MLSLEARAGGEDAPFIGVLLCGFELHNCALQNELEFTQRGVMLAVAVMFQQDRGAAKEGDDGRGRFVTHQWMPPCCTLNTSDRNMPKICNIAHPGIFVRCWRAVTIGRGDLGCRFCVSDGRRWLRIRSTRKVGGRAWRGCQRRDLFRRRRLGARAGE